MASPLYFPRFRAFTTNGVPLNGGKLYTYVPGTSTAKATYTTAALNVANANPVILDANGEANIFTGDGEAYKLVLYDSLDVLQWTLDNVVFGGSGDASEIVGSAPNLIDNGGFEVQGNRPGSGIAAGATATCFTDRWFGYRGGATGYSIQTSATNGFPRGVDLQRDAANANTTSLVVGQHGGDSVAGGSVIYGLFDTIKRSINPTLTGVAAQTLVLSVYLCKGANFSGTGATLQIVSNTGMSQNILSGSGWTVEASASLTAAQLSTTTWTRLSVPFTGAFTGAAVAIGWRLVFDAPSGTAGAADTLSASGFKAEIGLTGTPTAYTVPTPDDALIRAERFYRVFGDANARISVGAYGAASQNFDLPFQFFPPMAHSPTAAVAGTWAVSNCGQPSIVSANQYGFTLRTAVTALGAFSFAPNSSDDVITFEGEV